MALVWVISGMGRGVGKTWLARRLLEILPDAVSAKLGHGRKKPGKPEHYFTTQKELEAFVNRRRPFKRHILVESNRLARQDWGDLIVFIDAIAEQTDPREDVDEIRQKAEIPIRAGIDRHVWMSILLQKDIDPDLCEAICEALYEQLAFLARPRPMGR